MIEAFRKKKRFIMMIICVAAVICIVGIHFVGRKPFKKMKSSDIVSATVLLEPPDEKIVITDVSELVEDLNEVVIYNRNQSYHNYVGQAVTFTLTMSDGTQMNVMAYNPFIVINGIGYKTKYEPCEKLNQYANRLSMRKPESKSLRK